MAAVQRTLPGGECVAALWLHDAQVQKHVSNMKLTVAIPVSVTGADCSRLGGHSNVRL